MISLLDYILEAEENDFVSLNRYLTEADDDFDLGSDDGSGGDDEDGGEDDKKKDDKGGDEDKKPGDKEKAKLTERGEIKFTIWKTLNKKVDWIEDKEPYQKIEYKYINKEKKIEIDFLLGYNEDKNTWEYWIGRIGSLNYGDDPYCDLETPKFAEAIVKALDKTQEFLDDVKKNPDNWIQFYKTI